MPEDKLAHLSIAMCASSRGIANSVWMGEASPVVVIMELPDDFVTHKFMGSLPCIFSIGFMVAGLTPTYLTKAFATAGS